jgi:hypothetical protein
MVNWLILKAGKKESGWLLCHQASQDSLGPQIIFKWRKIWQEGEDSSR